MNGSFTYVRSLWAADLSPLARRLIVGQLFIGLGNGIVTPSWFLYLDRVRGFGPGIAGASFTVRAIGMIALVPIAGWLVDRHGPRGVVFTGTMCNTAGALALGFFALPTAALGGSFLAGAGVALTGPATRTVLLESVSPDERRPAAAASFQMWNLGLGAGGLIGGIIANPREPITFTVLFVALAALGVATRSLNLPAMPKTRTRSPRAHGPERALLNALRSRAFACYLIIATLLQFAGYGQTTSGLPGLATTLLGVAPSIIGIALAVNTAIILLAGPATRRLVHHRRSSNTLGAVGLLWAASWGLIAAATLTMSRGLTGVSVVGFYAIFGIGEAVLAAVSTPLVATLAPPGALGTYLGLDTLTRQIGGALGPAVSGALIASHAVHLYLALTLFTCLLAYIAAQVLRHILTNRQDNSPTVLAHQAATSPGRGSTQHAPKP